MAGRPPPPRFVQLRTATRGEPDRGEGSRTITVEQDDENEAVAVPDFDGVLTLRGGPTHGHRVTWQEGTVDNEFLNRKKSKICCIFHKAKPKTFEDPFAGSSSSSSDDSNDSSSESESECSSCDARIEDGESLNGQDKQGRSSNAKGKERASDTGGEEVPADGQGQAPDQDNGQTPCCHRHSHSHQKKHKSRQPKPNAYEHQPKYGKRTKKRDKGSSTMTVTE